MDRTRTYWLCQIGGWTTFVVLRIGVSTFFRDVTWTHAGFAFTMGAAGFLYTHLYRLLIRRRGWTRLSLQQLAPRVVGAAIVIAALMHFTADPVGRYLLDLEFYQNIDSEVGIILASVVNGAILIMVWSLIYFGVHIFWSHRQAEVDKWKLEAQAETARLKALKLQLNPHFFFNSLNSVRALIAEDPERAQRMVTRLARLLRSTLQVDDVKTVPLEEELSTVQTYLELEMVRFEERLEYRIDAEDDALGCPVPFLLVQTLVENGIKHGIAQRQGGGTISIRATVAVDGLCIRVTNPGTLESEEGGTGLDNARERLELLFGAEASLALENVDTDTVAATALLPTETKPHRENGESSSRVPSRSLSGAGGNGTV